MPVTWTPEKDQAFFIQLLAVVDVKLSREQWQVVAQKLGPEYTGEALRQHYQAMRRRVLAQDGDTATAPTTDGSGKGRKRKADAKATKLSGSAVDEDEDEGLSTPKPKKSRTQIKKQTKAARVKKEEDDDGNDGDMDKGGLSGDLDNSDSLPT